MGGGYGVRGTGLEALPTLDEAVARVLEAARDAASHRDAVSERDTCEARLWDAQGRVLCEDVFADRDDPPFARAAMDGYAVRASDVAGASDEAPATLRVVGQHVAGAPASAHVGAGQAVAVTTGAPMASGGDAVVMVERTWSDGETVHVHAPIAAGRNVAAQGELVRAGERVVLAGTAVHGAVFAALAGVGASRLRVWRRPRVTVIATGTELVGVEEAPGPAQIRNSNQHALMALVERHGARPVDGGRVADDRDSLRHAIREGLRSDVLVLSGGVSAGSKDHVRGCLEAEGVEVLFHGCRLKPGKPVLVGRHHGAGLDRHTAGQAPRPRLVFGLPGNPVSAFVTASLLTVPALHVLGHRPSPGPWALALPLHEGMPATRGRRTTIQAGRLVGGEDGSYSVAPLPWRGSADVAGFSRGDVLIRRDVDAPEAPAGARVLVYLPAPLAP